MDHCPIVQFPTKCVHVSITAALLVLAAGLLSNGKPVNATPFVVTNTLKSGSGSLRQAITYANNDSGPDTIAFAAALNGIPIVLFLGQDLKMAMPPGIWTSREMAI